MKEMTKIAMVCTTVAVCIGIVFYTIIGTANARQTSTQEARVHLIGHNPDGNQLIQEGKLMNLEYKTGADGKLVLTVNYNSDKNEVVFRNGFN